MHIISHQHEVHLKTTNVASLQGIEISSIVSSLPAHICTSGAVTFGIRVHAALTVGNTTAFLRMWQQADWRQKRLMRVRIAKASPFHKSRHVSKIFRTQVLYMTHSIQQDGLLQPELLHCHIAGTCHFALSDHAALYHTHMSECNASATSACRFKSTA